MPYPSESVFDAVPLTADGQNLIAPRITVQWLSADTLPLVVVHGVANLEKAKEIHLRMPGMETPVPISAELCPPPLPNEPWLIPPHHHATIPALTQDDMKALARICKNHGDHPAE